jgi:hypothetical protein
LLFAFLLADFFRDAFLIVIAATEDAVHPVKLALDVVRR